jgi:DNA-directed RNA polymerase subunit alpha
MRVAPDTATLGPRYGSFIIEPFERGYGTTVGHSLQRILLSMLDGAAIFAVKIKGFKPGSPTLAGIEESVEELILNLKSLRVRMDGDGPATLRIELDRKGLVTGADVVSDGAATVVDTSVKLFTLTHKTKFEMELRARRGRGYMTSEEVAAKFDLGAGEFAADAFFSPVQRVRYRIESTRVGKMTDYDRLTLEIWTDGTIHPEDALVASSRIFRKHLNPFVLHFNPGHAIPSDEEQELEAEKAKAVEAEREETLDLPISALDLSVRASNCILSENINTIRDLVSKTEEDILNIRNFGKTSLREIRKKLEDLGLSLGFLAGQAPKEN